MAKGLRADTSTDGHQKTPPLVQPAQDVPWANDPPLPPVLWPSILAQKSYTFTFKDQSTWLCSEHGTAMPDYAQGHFTIRLNDSPLSNNNKIWKCPNTLLPQGVTHMLFHVCDCLPGEDSGRILQVFLVDLRKAMLHLSLGKRQINKRDNVVYQLFDPLDAGVEKFCERLRT